ncbi:hypothetical protein GCM10022221_32000 [Actinocorallia aurea]
MRREWKLEDLIECWTLDEAEVELLANKSGATRSGFALLLKFFELPAHPALHRSLPGIRTDGRASAARRILPRGAAPIVTRPGTARPFGWPQAASRATLPVVGHDRILRAADEIRGGSSTCRT